uniref:Ig-like domain-containing protein n=1 Tax=Ditylenchus dipsaci TaxID=166011 RepID=A0A915CT05_9BILA
MKYVTCGIVEIDQVVDGKKLEDSGSFLLNENQQLHIEEVQEKHAGRYSCVAENVPGRAEKDPIVVSLLKAPVMMELTKAVEIQENDTQTLTCPVEVTNDQSTVFEWSRNGVPISSSSNLQLSGSGRMLHIMRAQTSDSGSYSCLAQNEAGEDEAIFTVIVLVPPSIQGPVFRNLESILNQTVQLHCQTNGIPQPEVEWFQDGQRIFSGSNSLEILKNGTVLRVNGIQLEHEGRYTCMATNKVGKAEADTFVQVIGKCFHSNTLPIFKLRAVSCVITHRHQP